MATAFRVRWLVVVLATVFVSWATAVWADPAAGEKTPASSAAASSAVDVFAAMHDGDIGVQFIARDSREATLILTNNTDKPLSVRLPDAFAAIPVLAQPAGVAVGRGPGTGNKQTQNQPVGASTQRQQPVGLGGAFNIPPERMVKLKLPTVCLEYGKAEPNAHVRYTIEPIETYTSNPEVQEVCRLLGTDTVDQQVAQAAAWHLANHLSWDKLAGLKHFPHNRGFTRPVFTSEQIRAAMKLTDKAVKMADAHPHDSPVPAE